MPAVELAVPGVDLASTLGPIAMQRSDPTVRLRPGRFDRATRTPDGAAALRVTWSPTSEMARVEAWGEGATWVLDRAPGLLGLHDDPSDFEPCDPVVARLAHLHPRLRLTRTATLWHDLAWIVVQQRVTTRDAAEQWRRLTLAMGEPAPGPLGLTLPPAAADVARQPYHAFHRFGLERQRADRLRRAARAALRLERTVDDRPDAALRLLGGVPGLGPWTTGNLAALTWGDADAVVVGDYGLPGMVGWVLEGRAGADDARMLHLLEPHRPHRHRVVRLLLRSGSRPPRRHHRLRRVDIRSR